MLSVNYIALRGSSLEQLHDIKQENIISCHKIYAKFLYKSVISLNKCFIGETDLCNAKMRNAAAQIMTEIQKDKYFTQNVIHKRTAERIIVF